MLGDSSEICQNIALKLLYVIQSFHIICNQIGRPVLSVTNFG